MNHFTSNLQHRRASALPLLLAVVLIAGCSKQQDSASAANTTSPSASDNQSASATLAPQIAPSPSPLTTPAVPNADELSGIILRFYNDVGSQSGGDLSRMLSPAFYRSQHFTDWNQDYGFIRNPQVTIDSSDGPNVDYTLNYDYVSDDKSMKVLWIRKGTWLFSHGSGKWYLESDTWKSMHIVGISNASGTTTNVTDQVYADGHRTFAIPGEIGTFTITSNGGWKVSYTSTETAPPISYPVPDNAPAASTNSNDAAPAAPRHYPPPASDNCEEADVTAVYDDGKILELDDGRHLQVDDSDTSTSSVWTPPFDGLICNGDKFINKDDNESVDLAP
jgi:hypothetical protein